MSRKRLNLLPEEMRPKGPAAGAAKRLQRPRAGAVGLAGALFLAWASWTAWRQMDPGDLRSRVAAERKLQQQLSEELEQRSADLDARRARLIDERAQLEKMLRSLSPHNSLSMPLSDALIRLVDVVPEGVWLTKLAYRGEQMVISGTTPQAEAITAFIQQLQRSPHFQNTTFAYAQKIAADSKEKAAGAFNFEISTLPVPAPAAGGL